MGAIGLFFGMPLSGMMGKGGGVVFTPIFRHHYIGATPFTDTHGNTIASTALRQFGANVTNYAGVLQAVSADVPRVPFGHVVENLVKFSEDVRQSSYNWGGVSTPNADTIVIPVGGQYWKIITRRPNVLFTFEAKAGTANQVTLGYIPIALTSSWKTYAVLLGNVGGIGFIQSVTVGGSIHVRNFEAVDVTGMPALYVPPYVPRLTAAPAYQWFDTDSSNLTVAGNVVTDSGQPGNALHPSKQYLGDKLYLDIQAFTNGNVVLPTGMREMGGRYYSTVLGGTINGTNPANDIGVTDWIDEGIYHPEFSHLMERATVNIFVNPLAPATQTITIGVGDYTLSVGDVGDTGSIAITAGTATITGAGTASVGTDVTINCTVAGTIVCTLTGTLTRVQLETGKASTTFINGQRYEEQGMVKYPTTGTSFGGAGFKHSAGTLFASMVPQHDLSMHGNSHDLLFGPVTSALGLLGSGFNQGIISNDGTTTALIWQADSYTRNHAMQFCVEWDDGTDPNQPVSRFRIGYRNATTGTAWAWSAWSAYDGAFTDTGIFKFLAAGGLGWGIRNSLVYPRPLTTAEQDGFITP